MNDTYPWIIFQVDGDGNVTKTPNGEYIRRVDDLEDLIRQSDNLCGCQESASKDG